MWKDLDARLRSDPRDLSHKLKGMELGLHIAQTVSRSDPNYLAFWTQ